MVILVNSAILYGLFSSAPLVAGCVSPPLYAFMRSVPRASGSLASIEARRGSILYDLGDSQAAEGDGLPPHHLSAGVILYQW
jgi:hypothetical protein